MYYSFRIRINRSNRNYVDTDLREVRIPSRDTGLTLFPRSAVEEKCIKEAEQLVYRFRFRIRNRFVGKFGRRWITLDGRELFLDRGRKTRQCIDQGRNAPDAFCRDNVEFNFVPEEVVLAMRYE